MLHNPPWTCTFVNLIKTQEIRAWNFQILKSIVRKSGKVEVIVDIYPCMTFHFLPCSTCKKSLTESRWNYNCLLTFLSITCNYYGSLLSNFPHLSSLPVNHNVKQQPLTRRTSPVTISHPISLFVNDNGVLHQSSMKLHNHSLGRLTSCDNAEGGWGN